jgi:hypothetical protein
LALYMAFRLAGRLTGGPRAVRWGAGALAAVALLLTPLWVRYMAHGNEAPMAIFFLLWGIERHLDAKFKHALVLGFLACLLRPEVAPFIGVYGAYLFWKQPEVRRLAIGLAIALPVLWLVPEWIGSGNPLGAGQKATGEPPWSLSLRDKPWLAALERAHSLIGLALEIGVIAAVVLAIRSREKTVLWLAGAAAAWVGLIVLMTQLGFSGNSRYFLVPLAIACVVGAAGAGKLVMLAPSTPVQAAVAAVILVGAGLYVSPRLERLDRQAKSVERLAKLQSDLETAVDRAGGAKAIEKPYPTVNRGFVTRMAWEVKVPIGDVEAASGEGVVFAARSHQAGSQPRPAAALQAGPLAGLRPARLRPRGDAGPLDRVGDAALELLEQLVVALAHVQQGVLDLLRPLGLALELGGLGGAGGEVELDPRARAAVAYLDHVLALGPSGEVLLLHALEGDGALVVGVDGGARRAAARRAAARDHADGQEDQAPAHAQGG